MLRITGHIVHHEQWCPRIRFYAAVASTSNDVRISSPVFHGATTTATAVRNELSGFATLSTTTAAVSIDAAATDVRSSTATASRIRHGDSAAATAATAVRLQSAGSKDHAGMLNFGRIFFS